MITYTFKEIETPQDGIVVTKAKDRVIVKSGHETEFTLADMEANEKGLEKNKKEIVPVIEHRKAVMKNVSENHPIVLELTPEQRHAVYMYREAEVELETYEKTLERVDEVLAKSAVEKAEIYKQLNLE
jgi:hypothetical protein